MEDMVEARDDDDDDHFLHGLIKSSRPILEQKIYNIVGGGIFLCDWIS